VLFNGLDKRRANQLGSLLQPVALVNPEIQTLCGFIAEF
jgi:hypothetical protein